MINFDLFLLVQLQQRISISFRFDLGSQHSGAYEEDFNASSNDLDSNQQESAHENNNESIDDDDDVDGVDARCVVCERQCGDIDQWVMFNRFSPFYFIAQRERSKRLNDDELKSFPWKEFFISLARINTTRVVSNQFMVNGDIMSTYKVSLSTVAAVDVWDNELNINSCSTRRRKRRF